MSARTTPKGTRPNARGQGPKAVKPRGRDAEKVIVAFPHGHEVSARFLKSMLGMFAYDGAHKGRIMRGGDFCAVSSGANITNARNEIVEAFLDRCTAEWLLFIDTDMVFDSRAGHREGIAGPDLVDLMVEAAHPTERPIVGALCYSLHGDGEVKPTVYGFSEDGKVIRYSDYPRDQVFKTGATGTGCMIIHRSVLVKMRKELPKPYQWFQETHFGDIPCGEDITFCVRANLLNFPVHVDSRIKVGHEKPFVVDESMFLAQLAWKDSLPKPPTYVVIPGRDRHDMTYRLLEQLANQVEASPQPLPSVFLYDNGSDPAYAAASSDDDHVMALALVESIDATDWPLHRMWNDGLDRAAKAAAEAGHEQWQVAILNNDLEVPADFLAQLTAGLRRRDDYMIAYPNIHGLDLPPNTVALTQGMGNGPTGRSLSGYAFMVRGEDGLRIDEQFEWWYGDDDLERQVIERGGKVVCVPTTVNHLEPNKSTVTSEERQEMAHRDRERFFAKWPQPVVVEEVA